MIGVFVTRVTGPHFWAPTKSRNLLDLRLKLTTTEGLGAVKSLATLGRKLLRGLPPQENTNRLLKADRFISPTQTLFREEHYEMPRRETLKVANESQGLTNNTDLF